jgi:ABC-2 type transport system permease protein
VSLAERARLLRRMVSINIAGAIAYRTDIMFFMLGAVFGPLLSATIWRAAIASGASVPMSTSDLMTYFVLMALVSTLTSSWLSGFLADEIRNGSLSIWLARPGSFLYELAANNISEKAIKLTILVPLVALFGWLLREDIDLSVPAWRWLAAAASVLLGAVIAFSIDVAEGSLAFWMDDISGIIRARALFALVLSGQLLPLQLMPEWSQDFLMAQPFRYIISFPLELITGDLSQAEIAAGAVAQVAYAIAFAWLARTVWRRGQYSYSAVGA